MKLVSTSALIAAAFLACVSPAGADEQKKLVVKGEDPIRESLDQLKGKPVSLRLRSGEELGGTISEIGENAVSITGLTGREYYDAVVLIDDVAAVIARAK